MAGWRDPYPDPDPDIPYPLPTGFALPGDNPYTDGSHPAVATLN